MLAFFRKFAFSLLIAFAAANVCFAQALLDTEEYAVYSAVFRHYFQGEPEGSIAIHRTTDGDPIEGKSVKYLFDRSSKIDLFLIYDFNAKNKQEAEIENLFGFSNQVYILRDELREIFIPNLSVSELLHEKDRKEFRKRYGNSGLFSLSRVGFNQKRRKALVVMGNMSGWLGGEGNYYILEKLSSGWKVRKKIPGWIS